MTDAASSLETANVRAQDGDVALIVAVSMKGDVAAGSAPRQEFGRGEAGIKRYVGGCSCWDGVLEQPDNRG